MVRGEAATACFCSIRSRGPARWWWSCHGVLVEVSSRGWRSSPCGVIDDGSRHVNSSQPSSSVGTGVSSRGRICPRRTAEPSTVRAARGDEHRRAAEQLSARSVKLRRPDALPAATSANESERRASTLRRRSVLTAPQPRSSSTRSRASCVQRARPPSCQILLLVVAVCHWRDGCRRQVRLPTEALLDAEHGAVHRRGPENSVDSDRRGRSGGRICTACAARRASGCARSAARPSRRRCARDPPPTACRARRSVRPRVSCRPSPRTRPPRPPPRPTRGSRGWAASAAPSGRRTASSCRARTRSGVRSAPSSSSRPRARYARPASRRP